MIIKRASFKVDLLDNNSRVIYDVIHCTLEKHIPGVLLLIEFENVFDSFS